MTESLLKFFFIPKVNVWKNGLYRINQVKLFPKWYLIEKQKKSATIGKKKKSRIRNIILMWILSLVSDRLESQIRKY
jgi:hypothetical protein